MNEIRKVYLMDKKDAFKNAQGEVDLAGAPWGTKTKVAQSDVVAVLGRGSKIEVLKTKQGSKPVGRVSPVKFLRMLIDGSI